jgi:uncharacterized protein
VIAPDVNVLIYAAWAGAPEHSAYKELLENARQHERPLILFEPVLAGFFRILTSRHVLTEPFTFAKAETWVESLLATEIVVVARAGERHWNIFLKLCRSTRAAGNLAADAYLAALAIEHGCQWITADRDFARFPGLKWSHPFE